MTTRAEHVAWCKERALEYVDDPPQAVASLTSDLGKHPDTVDHAARELGMIELLSGGLRTPGQVRDFVDGVS